MVRLYMDVHIPRGDHARAPSARHRRPDGLEDGARRFLDDQLLDRATELGRVLFTEDDDLLAEAARRQRMGESFARVIYIQERNVRIEACVDNLQLIAEAMTPQEMANWVQYLPL
jgi:3'-phosphoadenosine 5'-phosphosulfate sulfotransferase